MAGKSILSSEVVRPMQINIVTSMEKERQTCMGTPWCVVGVGERDVSPQLCILLWGWGV